VLEETVACFNDEPANIMAWLGPAIGPRAFEVGPEVREAFMEKDPQAVEAFLPSGINIWPIFTSSPASA
jgi:copper oxidase (laccase) domain-containing protein